MIEVTQVFVPAANCNGCGDAEATVTIRFGDYNQATLIRLCDDCSAALVEALS